MTPNPLLVLAFIAYALAAAVAFYRQEARHRQRRVTLSQCEKYLAAHAARNRQLTADVKYWRDRYAASVDHEYQQEEGT